MRCSTSDTAVLSTLERLGVVSATVAVISLGFSILAAAFVLMESGKKNASLLCDSLMYLAYWPSILTGQMDQNIASPRQLATNAIGWSAVAVLLVMLSRTRRRRPRSL